MKDVRKSFEQICGEVAKTTNFSPSEDLKSAQLADLLAAVSEQKAGPGRISRLFVFSAAAALLLIVAAAWIFVSRAKENEAVEFWVGRLPVKGELNLRMTSTASETIPIQFEGGSQIELSNNSEARVRQSERKRVVVDLGRGSLKADIRKRGKTEWIILGGAYQVKVWGTAFTVNWQPESAKIEVRVQRGVVTVHGPGLSGDGVRLAAGERFYRARTGLSERDKRSPDTVELTPSDANESDSEEKVLKEAIQGASIASETKSKERSKECRTTVPDLLEDIAGPKEVDPPEPVSNWQLSLERGEFDKAVEEAKAVGIENIIETQSIETLWQLADAARYGKHNDVAEKLLTAVRKKAPDSQPAGSASFVLGKLALDRKDLDDAAKWFRNYLEENPNRPMAEEALGRLVWVYQRRGQIEKARAAAKDYLSRYPDGPFEHVARAVLDDEASLRK